MQLYDYQIWWCGFWVLLFQWHVCRCQLWHQWSLFLAFTSIIFHCRPLQRLSLWELTLVAASALAVSNRINGFVHQRWVLRWMCLLLAVSVHLCLVAASFIVGRFSFGFIYRYWLWWRLQHWLCSFAVTSFAGGGSGDYDCMYGFSRSTLQ